jgi:hypothetical protein
MASVQPEDDAGLLNAFFRHCDECTLLSLDGRTKSSICRNRRVRLRSVSNTAVEISPRPWILRMMEVEGRVALGPIQRKILA